MYSPKQKGDEEKHMASSFSFCLTRSHSTNNEQYYENQEASLKAFWLKESKIHKKQLWEIFLFFHAELIGIEWLHTQKLTFDISRPIYFIKHSLYNKTKCVSALIYISYFTSKSAFLEENHCSTSSRKDGWDWRGPVLSPKESKTSVRLYKETHLWKQKQRTSQGHS